MVASVYPSPTDPSPTTVELAFFPACVGGEPMFTVRRGVSAIVALEEAVALLDAAESVANGVGGLLDGEQPVDSRMAYAVACMTALSRAMVLAVLGGLDRATRH